MNKVRYRPYPPTHPLMHYIVKFLGRMGDCRGIHFRARATMRAVDRIDFVKNERRVDDMNDGFCEEKRKQ